MGRYVEARDDSAASVRMPLVTLGGSRMSAMSALLGRAAVKADMPKRQLCANTGSHLGVGTSIQSLCKTVAMVVK